MKDVALLISAANPLIFRNYDMHVFWCCIAEPVKVERCLESKNRLVPPRPKNGYFEGRFLTLMCLRNSVDPLGDPFDPTAEC